MRSNYIKTDSAIVISHPNNIRDLKELVSLWYFIYSEQKSKLKNLNKLIRIHSDDLAKFRYKVNGEDFRHSSVNILEFIKAVRTLIPIGQYPYSYKILTKFLNKGTYDAV
jgi:hypothetical protein